MILPVVPLPPVNKLEVLAGSDSVTRFDIAARERIVAAAALEGVGGIIPSRENGVTTPDEDEIVREFWVAGVQVVSAPRKIDIGGHAWIDRDIFFRDR